MITPGVRRGFDWEAAGAKLGADLDSYHALVVIGADPVTTGRVAVGLARVQAAHRRVAIGDLFAESPPIQDLVHTDDPHGIVDSFIYGVSLSRIAYEVPGAGQLYVMPSGTEPPSYEEILPNPRWLRLSAGFREVGALLVLAAPASAPHIEDLVAASDGAVLVGNAVVRSLPVARIIASVNEPRVVAAPAPSPSTPGRGTGLELGLVKPPASPPPAPKPAPKPAPTPTSLWSGRRMASAAGLALTLALGIAALWLAYRPLAGGSLHKTLGHDTTGRIVRVTPAKLDSLPPDSTAAAAVVTMPHVINPADSAAAAAFGVELEAANTQAGAILKLQQDGKKVPAATFAPVMIQGARWFKVIGGAYVDRASADSLLAGLRRRKVLDAGNGAVVRLPFAFLIESDVPASAVNVMLTAYAERGQPVYALQQADGSAWLLAGAFESLDQSALYVESLRASGITPVLVYRKGRMF